MKSKIILVLLFFISSANAQHNPLQFKTITYHIPKLELTDTIFMENLSKILFHEDCSYMNSNELKHWRCFNIGIDRLEDGVNYQLWIELWELPDSKSIGYLEYNDYIYGFVGDVIPDIFTITGNNKRISYNKEKYFGIIDPPLWILKYNSQTKEITIVNNIINLDE